MADQGLIKGWTRPTVFGGTPPAISADQLALFPRQTWFELPHPQGKDIHSFVQADNGRRYYLKIDKGDLPIRANEWIAHRLAALVGVVTPKCEFVQTTSGDVAFGSEAVDSASKQADTVRYLEQVSLNELGMPIAGLRESLSAIHVLDLFLNNIDRHIANYLVIEDGEFSQVLALDFARAVFWRWPWNGFLQPDDNTVGSWREMRERHGFDQSAAIRVVDRLGIITATDVENMLRQMPAHWLSDALASELLTYCRDGSWAARVQLLRKGLENGSIV